MKRNSVVSNAAQSLSHLPLLKKKKKGGGKKPRKAHATEGKKKFTFEDLDRGIIPYRLITPDWNKGKKKREGVGGEDKAVKEKKGEGLTPQYPAAES